MSSVNICLNKWKNKWVIAELLHWWKTNTNKQLGIFFKKVSKTYIIVSVGQESACGLAGSFGSGSLTRLWSRYWSGLWSSQGSTWGGSISNITHVVIGRKEFLVCCWTEGFSSLLAVGQKIPSVPCQMGLSIGQLTTQQLALLECMGSARERERVLARQKSQLL